MTLNKECCDPLDLRAQTCKRCPDMVDLTRTKKEEIKETLEKDVSQKKQRNLRSNDKGDNL